MLSVVQVREYLGPSSNKNHCFAVVTSLAKEVMATCKQNQLLVFFFFFYL